MKWQNGTIKRDTGNNTSKGIIIIIMVFLYLYKEEFVCNKWRKKNSAN